MEQRKLRLLISSLVALVALQMPAEAKQLPRLVVCITVDQLRSDYLQELTPLMGNEGFRLMLSRGQYIPNVRFPLYQINAASATATLFTGAYPSSHGVEAPTIYERGTGRTRPIFWDDANQGNYTRDALSPRALLVGTLGDRFKEASAGTALVYSIAPNSEEAMVSAGASADGAYWLDSRIGSWATSNYYPQMLPLLEQYNRSAEGPNKRLIAGDFTWKPLRSYSDPSISFSSRARSFSYRYQGSDATKFKQSALANEEVTNLALRLLETAGYEQRRAPGLLSLSYTAAPHTASELDAEDVDTYVRLDQQLARLLTALDKRFGLDNCLISLSGTGYTSYKTYTSTARGTSTVARKVSTERLSALSGMFLTASYGAGEWILSNKNGRIYLNRKLIGNRKLSLERMQQELAEFVRLADGIADAQSITSVRSSLGNEELRRVDRSVHSRYEADIYYSLLPGWTVEEQDQNPQLRAVSTAIPSPFILMGAGVLADGHNISSVYEATDIVRVICDILRIRPPNGAH